MGEEGGKEWERKGRGKGKEGERKGKGRGKEGKRSRGRSRGRKGWFTELLCLCMTL